MRKLILIKHSMPNLSSDIPSNEWILSQEGKEQSKKLADKLKPYHFSKLFCSTEPKAIETAQIAGESLSKSVQMIDGVHEHERKSSREIYPQKQWKEIIRTFFQRPDELILGDETANSAQNRFINAIHSLIENENSDEDIVIVTHGTVMTLFISKYNDVDSFDVWDSFGLPSYVELSIPGYELQKIINM
jgi:broad specificity phosphatase PhoE